MHGMYLFLTTKLNKGLLDKGLLDKALLLRIFLGLMSFLVLAACAPEEDTETSLASCEGLGELTDRNHLSSGGRLSSGEFLVSENLKYILVMQESGNVELRQVDTLEVIWETQTVSQEATYLRFQGDGNLVLRNNSGQALWSSRRNV